MQRRIILLLVFMSASLAAMNNEGTWDEHGNYLGPANQTNMPQPYMPAPGVMMIPQLVYMPVYVDEYGQQIMPPMMHQPLAPYQLAMGQQFGMMPPVFPTLYSQQPRIEPSLDQWAVPAPVQNVDVAGAEHGAQSDDRNTPPLQAAVLSSSTASTALADVEKSVESDLAPQTSAVAQVVPSDTTSDEDKEVENITKRMERASIDDHANQANQAPIVHWADVQDSPSPKIAVHASSSSSSASSTASTSPMLSQQAKPTAISYLQVVKKNKSSGNTRLAASRDQMSSSSSDKPKKSMNERLEDAFAQLHTSNAPDKLPQLTQNKFDWINTLRHEYDRMSEWEKLAQLFERSGTLSVQVEVPQEATSLLHLAGTLVENAKKIDKKSPARKRFARLAVQCVNSASAALPARLVAQASDISTQAASLLPEPKKGAQDQTSVPEEEFYKGYTFADEKPEVRSNTKAVARPVVQHVKKVAPQKTGVPQAKASQGGKSTKKKKKSAPNPAVQKVPEQPQPSLQERIEKLLDGNKTQFKEGLSLLEQVAEGSISGVDQAFQVNAMRQMGSFYLYGYVHDSSGTCLVERDLSRAHYFIRKALDTNDVYALLDMLPLEFEQGRQNVYAYADRLESHSDADDLLKQFARVYRAAARFMDDEQGQLAGESLAVFQKIHNEFSFDKSMLPIANVLPKAFYVWMHHRLPVWQRELSESKDDVDDNASAHLEWLYLIGRLHIDACQEGNKRFDQVKYDAMGWIKTAADCGHSQARLYLAKPGNGLCVYDRIRHLRATMNSTEQRSQAEMSHAIHLSESYAQQGFLDSMTDYLRAHMSTPEAFGGALRKLGQNFPRIRILGQSGGLYQLAEQSGMIDELKRRAQDDWVARGILSALDISRYRDTTVQASAEAVAQIDNALARIQADVKDHPQLASVVAACYSTRAFVIKRISSEVSYGTLDQGIQLMKQVYRDYEESVKREDLFGKFCYGVLLLNTNLGLMQKAAGTINLYEKGIVLLHEVANGQDGEYKLAVLETLATHYSGQRDWNKVDEYLKKAHEYALSIHQDARAQSITDLEKNIRVLRNQHSQLNRRDALKEGNRLLAAKKAQSAQNSEIIQNLKRADECVVFALQKARTNPFEALRDLRTMDGLNIQRHLDGNPRMIALCYMVLDDLCAAASDTALIKESARGPFLKTLDPFYHTMGQASLAYQQKFNKPDYRKNKFEELIRAYLNAYHLRERVAEYIRAARTEGNSQATQPAMVSVNGVASMMGLWTSDQQDEYLRICEDDVKQKRAAYQAALDEEAVALNAALEKCKTL